MSDDSDDRDLRADGALDDDSSDDDADEPSPTPFDHPLFLPALFVAFALWFGYDGWFNPHIESVQFNRIMFGVWVVGALWFGRKGWLELREDRERAASASRGETAD